jgi:hypothetical protein
VTAKIIRFLPAVPPVDRCRAPAAGRDEPVRTTIATALDLPGLPPPPFAAVVITWPLGEDDPGAAAPVGESALVVTVDETVVRGADALAARFAAGGERFKMMSFGRRNPALTRAGFVERWRAEAGRLGGDPIPDDLRGLAYVQGHPRGDDPPLDAVNEVWFDRLDDVRRRAEWFARRPVPADLMAPATCGSLVLREVVVA